MHHYRASSLEFSKTPVKSGRIADAPALFALFYALFLARDERARVSVEKALENGIKTATTIGTNGEKHLITHPTLEGDWRHYKTLRNGYFYEGFTDITKVLLHADGMDARLSLFWLQGEKAEVPQFRLPESYTQNALCVRKDILSLQQEPYMRGYGMRVLI